jgi:hypothetical protein
MVAMVFFDKETEEICRELDNTLILASDELRRRLDSKIVTTNLARKPRLLRCSMCWVARTVTAS